MKVNIKKLPEGYVIYKGRVVLKSSFGTPAVTTSLPQEGLRLPDQLQFINALGDRVVNASIEDYIKRVATKAVDLMSTTNKLQSQTTKLTQRVSTLERKSTTVYVPPKVTPKYLTSQKGKPVDMNFLLTALETDYGQLRSALGGVTKVLKSIRIPSASLNEKDRLNGKGAMGVLPSWNTTPVDLADSLTNSWLTIMDIRDAVEDLKAQTTPTTCSAVTFGAKVSLTDSVGIVNGIRLIFTDTVLPTGWSDCDKAKGCKITVKDSSLNTITRHVQIYQFVNNDEGYLINKLGNLDTTSNFDVTIEYCFTDGSNQCAKIETHTLANSTTCPTVALSSVTHEGFRIDVSSISTSLGYSLAVIVEDPSGTQIEVMKPTTTSPTFAKVLTGLSSGTSYNVYAEITSKGGQISTCPVQSITTTAPACSVSSILFTNYNKSATTLPFVTGGQTQLLACYASGGTVWETVAGFKPDNTPIIYHGSLFGGTCADGSFVKYGSAISQDATQALTCGDTVYTTSGISVSNAGSGWRFLAPITSPNGITYYLFGLYNEILHKVEQVVYCCDCKSVWIGDSSDISNTIVETPYKKQYYCEAGNSVSVDVKILTNTSSKIAPVWTIVDSPINGRVEQSASPTGEENVIGRFKYTSTASAGFISDSFRVQVTNSCGTSNTYTIPIQEASKITYRDTDIYVFVDANSVSDVDANNIKTQFNTIKTQYQTNCSAWTGNVYYIPVSDTSSATANSSGNYLDYVKSLFDMRNAASGSITVASGTSGAVNWDTWKSLPPYWNASTTLTVPVSANVIAFTDMGYTYGDYASTSLSAGWGTQPTTIYKNNYDEVVDLFNGTAFTTWAGSKSMTNPQFPNGFKFTLVPIINGSIDETAGTLLQMLGAIAGKKLKQRELSGVMTGNVKFPVNLTNFMLDGTAPLAVPYDGAATTHNTMTGLTRMKTNVQFNLMSNLENGFTFAATNTDFKNFILGLMQSYSTAPNSTYNKCATSIANCGHVSGTDGGQTIELYAPDASAPFTCQGAGTASAGGPTGCIRIYNSTSIEFDSTVRAYTTRAACIKGDAGVANNELVDGQWYCQYNPAAKGSTSRKVAQYNHSAPYWRNAHGSAGHETIASGSCT